MFKLQYNRTIRGIIMIEKTNINGQPCIKELRVIVDDKGNTNYKLLIEVDREWRDTAKSFHETRPQLLLINGGKK